MGQWFKANGGPLALVVVGLAVTGFTSAYGWVLVALGLAWWLAAPLVRRLPWEIRRKGSASSPAQRTSSADDIESGARQRREREERAAELRKAARLIRSEIDYGRSMIRDALANGYFWGSNRTIPNEAWVKDNETLAREATAHNAHSAAAAAYHEFDRINHVVVEAGRQRTFVDRGHRLQSVIAAANHAEAALVVFDQSVSDPAWDAKVRSGS